MIDKGNTTKPNFIREYRTLLEKLLDTRVRLCGLQGGDEVAERIDPIIDELLGYFHLQIDRANRLIRENQR